MQTPEEFAAMLDRCVHTAEGMGERLTDTYRVADLIRARDAEIRADERAKVLAGFEVETAPCGQTKWTPGADPFLKSIECAVPPTKHGDWHVTSDGHRWRVTDALPVLSSRIRLVGPWEPIEEDA